jgi:YcxB-like protein
MDQVSAVFRTSLGEMTRALRAINYTNRIVRILWLLSWGAIVLVGVLIVTGVVGELGASALLFAPGLIVFLFWALPFYLAWLVRRNSPYWTEDVHAEFSASGIRIGSAGAEGFTEWRAVVRMVETRAFFLYFTSAQGGQFIPKRVLLPEEMEQLRRLFRDYPGKIGISPTWAPSEAMSPPLLQASFTLDPSEITRAGMVTARRTGSIWVWYLLMLLIVSFNTIPATYRQWTHGGFAAISIPVLLLGLSPLLIIAVGPPLAGRWAAKRLVRTGPSSQGTQHVGVADWGLQVSGPMSSGTLRWSSVMKAIETQEFFLFFLSRLAPVYIPKRLLSDADVAQVRQLTRSGLGSKAALLEE